MVAREFLSAALESAADGSADGCRVFQLILEDGKRLYVVCKGVPAIKSAVLESLNEDGTTSVCFWETSSPIHQTVRADRVDAVIEQTKSQIQLILDTLDEYELVADDDEEEEEEEEEEDDKKRGG